MTVKEFYAAIGGDYEGVVGRLYSEQIVKKFLLKFLDDKSFETLTNSLKAKDFKEAFRAAHTIKGVCQNLGFTEFLVSSSAMTEALRNEVKEGYEELYEKVAADYNKTMTYLKALQ